MKAILALLLVLSLSACGGSGGGASGMSMTDAAKQFVESTFKGDKEAWRAVACQAIRDQADQLDSIPRPEGFTVDFSDLKYQVKEESGDSATVSVSGKLKMGMAGRTVEQDIKDVGLAEVPMKREGGNWKACPKL